MSAAAPQNHRVGRHSRTDYYFSFGRTVCTQLLPIFFIFASSVYCESLDTVWSSAPSNESALVAQNIETGKVLFARNERTLLKPASTLKIMTGVAALKFIGGQATFQTKFSLSHDAKTLVVHGDGDPVLTSENIMNAVEMLSGRGMEKVEALYLDTRRYESIPERSGGRAYESAPSPLSIQFNSILISVCPDPHQKKVITRALPSAAGVVVQSDVRIGKETKLEIGGVQDSSIQVKGTIENDAACIIRYRSIPDPVELFGKILKDHLENAGVLIKRIERGRNPPAGTVLYEHASYPLSWITYGMNHFSTNMLAESLVYRLGCELELCSYERGLSKIKSMIREVDSEAAFHLEDGSGLSHANRVSALTLLKVIHAALSDPGIAPEFESSLSIGGVSGTLKRRNIEAESLLMRGKTGSLDGVSTLAGIVNSKVGTRIGYVVFGNNIQDKARAEKWEERVVQALYENY